MGNTWIEHVKKFAADNNISYMCAIADPRTKASYTKVEKPVKNKSDTKTEKVKTEKPVKIKTEKVKKEKPIKLKKLSYTDVVNIENSYSDYDKENQFIRIYKDGEKIPFQPGFKRQAFNEPLTIPKPIKKDTIIYNDITYTVEVYDNSFRGGDDYERTALIKKETLKMKKQNKELSNTN